MWVTTGNNIYYNTGNVGIGTNTSPGNILQVGNGGRLRIANSSSDYTLIGASDVESATNTRIAMYGNTHGAGYAGNMEYMATSTGNHMFFTGGTGTTYGAERLRIASNGNIGIGTNNPTTAKVVINGTAGQVGLDLSTFDQYTEMRVIRNSLSTIDKDLYLQFLAGASSKVRLYSNNGETLRCDNGSVRFSDGIWHGTISDTITKGRLYFAGGNTGVSCLAGGDNGSSGTTIEFRRFTDDARLAHISSGGTIYSYGRADYSDSRIKKDIEDINDDTALNKLLLIQPKTYNYIDVERNKGFGKVYGFIAQQIREVIPEATTITPSIIPNIYKSCLIHNKREVYHSIPLNVAIDTEVSITIDKNGERYKIKEIYEDYFVIDKDIESDEAFVYGYNADDVILINKDYIFTLNVCATQELHRRIEAQNVVIQSHEDRIKELEMKMERLLSGTT